MRNIKLKKRMQVLFTVFFWLLVFSGCKDIFGLLDIEDGGVLTDALVRVEIGGAASRTLLPDIVGDTEGLYYVLHFVPGTVLAASGVAAVTDYLHGTSSITLSLAPGVWDLVVRGFISQTEAQANVAANALVFAEQEVTVLNTGPTTITVELNPNEDVWLAKGDGNLNFSITLPDDADGTLTVRKRGGETIEIIETLVAGSNEGELDLPSGVYHLIVEAQNASGNIAVWRQLAYIYHNATTNAVRVFDTPHFRNPTGGVISSFSFSLFYEDVHINEDEGTITVIVPLVTDQIDSGTSRWAEIDITNLTPSIDFDGVRIEPASGIPQDFSNGHVYYTVYGPAGSVDYKVSVTQSFPTTTSLNDCLSKFPNNITNNPIPVSVDFSLTANWQDLLSVIETADKFVDLDLSACTMTGTEFNPDSSIPDGKDKIVSIALPDTARSISGSFGHFDNLKSFSGTGLTSVGERAFQNCTSLTMTELPVGINTIGDFAFLGCTNLALTELPIGVIDIGTSAFYNCMDIALTKLPDGLTSIGMSPFLGCTKLALTELPSNITSIGFQAFYNCTNLALTELPAMVTSIGDWAFSGCTNLALTELPEGVNYIGEGAFSNCPKLALSTLPAEITFIGYQTFWGCTSLVNIDISAVTSIGAGAFNECTSLASVTLGTIADSDFGYNHYDDSYSSPFPGNLRDVYFAQPEGFSAGTYVRMLSLGDWTKLTFNSTTDVASYLGNHSGDNTPDNPIILPVIMNLDTNWSALLNEIETAGKFVALDLSTCTMTGTEFDPDSNISAGKDKIVSINLPDTAISIASREGMIVTATFEHFDNLASFSGTGLISIGIYAFYRRTSLTMTSLPAGITSIGRGAFEGCSNLALTSLPDGIPFIDNSVFYTCASLVSIDISAVTSIGLNAFQGCTNLASVTLGTIAEVTFNNINTFPGNLRDVYFAAGGGAGTYVRTLPSLEWTKQ